MAPRYRYKKAAISSPLLKAERVEVKHVSDGLALLYGLGEGFLHLDYMTLYPEMTGEIFVRYLRIAGKEEEDIWRIVDSEVDVAVAKRKQYKSNYNRHAKAARKKDLLIESEWSHDSDSKVGSMYGESWFRLRHFAALVLADIRISETIFGVPIQVRAAKDANLTDRETEVANALKSQNQLETLLRLTDLNG